MSNIDPAMSSSFYQENNHGGARDNTIPRFYIRPVQNNFKSTAEGRPVYEDREYVEITIAGDRKTVVDTPVKEEHRQRWPQHYRAFKENESAPVQGTPIEEWAAITRSQAEELKYFNVRTVENLAALDDQGLSRCVPIGGHALRDRAQRFLDQAKGDAPAEVLAAKVDQQAATIAALEAQMAELLQRSAKPKADGE